MNEEYCISMLGDFRISRGKELSAAPTGHIGKPWNLIGYIAYNRGRHIPQKELEGLLWDADDGRNAAGALKVLLHRARKNLEALAPESGAELIVLKRGEYYWNEDVRTVSDTEQFMQAYEAGIAAKDLTEREELLRKAADIYNGDFMTGFNTPWTTPIAGEFHARYVDCVKRLAAIYEENVEHGETVCVCEKAVKFEERDEELYRRLIYALYMSGKQEKAIEVYRQVTDAFYCRFAITPSDELKALYKTILKNSGIMEADINMIKDNLTEHGEASGAFECEYGVFKDVYQLEARACARSGDLIFLCLITLEAKPDASITPGSIRRAMHHLENAINESLRKGDVFARYSISQYVILLSTLSAENVEPVLKRICTAFHRKYQKKDLKPVYRMQPVDPKD